MQHNTNYVAKENKFLQKNKTPVQLNKCLWWFISTQF